MIDLTAFMAPDWADVMKPLSSTIESALQFALARPQTLPTPNLIFNAFTRPLSSIKVIIVGQDPYPTPGHAMGLSFSVPSAVSPLPGSLRNIFTELHDDLGTPVSSNGDLTRWADQGVMLMNRTLTVDAGAPGSHRGHGWETVTEYALRILAIQHLQGQPMAAILWGRDARNAADLFRAMPIVESPHPSPLSAQRGFFGSRPFSRTNTALESQSVSGIQW